MGFLAFIVIAVIALALFAPGKFAGAGGSFGRAVRAFKEGLSGEDTRHPQKRDKSKQ